MTCTFLSFLYHLLKELYFEAGLAVKNIWRCPKSERRRGEKTETTTPPGEKKKNLK